MNEYNSNYTPPPPVSQPGKGKAIAALVLGIVALVLPVPFLDLACGIVGLFFAFSAGKEGYVGGMKTAGLVLSIIGTVSAAIFTLSCTCGGCLMISPWAW